MKLKQSRRLLLLLSLLFVMSTVLPLAASAEVVYTTHTKDSEDHLIWTQPAYYPIGVVGRELVIPDKDKPGEVKASPMLSPKGIFIDKRDHIFVADTGNSRIVEFDNNGNWLRYITVPDNPLNKPEGVFVTDNLDIYIADTANKRVIRLDYDGNVIREFHRPESRFIPEAFKYDPISLVVDKRGFLYIATLGGYQGLLQLDPEGNFQSFYGANSTIFSALDAVKRLLYTKEMYANEISKLPGSISSVAMDKDGFMYTTTAGQGITKNQIKKLSIKGLNLLENKDTYTSIGDGISFGETKLGDIKDKLIQPQLIDVAIDSNGNITAIDGQYKYISQYDSSGNLLFFWAGPSASNTTQLGLMKNPIAIDSNSLNDLYILDGQENVIQIYRLSEFGRKVNEANQLTIVGRYEESEGPWQEVLRLNSNFNPAMLGLGKAAYKRGDFQLAMHYFEEGGNHKGYAEAFWQVRLVWFQKHFSVLATVSLLALIIYLFAEKYTRHSNWRLRWRNRKRSTKPLIVELKHALYILKHPIDGFSAIRYENKGSYLSAIILLAGAFLALVIQTMYTSFTFNFTNLRNFNILLYFAQFFLIWIGWVVSNYLVSSIYRGEGRFRDVFIGSCYALVPIILIGIPLAIISNVMANSEEAIYEFIRNGMIAWTAIMFFWKIQSMQNYSVSETVFNIFMSLFAFIVLIILAVIIIGLTNDLKDFIIEIYQEVRLR